MYERTSAVTGTYIIVFTVHAELLVGTYLYVPLYINISGRSTFCLGILRGVEMVFLLPILERSQSHKNVGFFLNFKFPRLGNF